MIRFSLIVPTYNEAGWIRRCLESLRAQDVDRSSYEIIVSDGASPDGTGEIARTLSDRVVVAPKRGIAHGRNAGAAAATGEVLVFVDADTTLETDFLRQIDRVFGDPSVVGCTGVARPADGDRLARFVYFGTYGLVRTMQFVGMSLFPGICSAYRADAFRGIGGFREDLGITEDLDLSRRIRRMGKCLIVPAAKAWVSTRRLQQNAMSVILFHIFNDIRYLTTGRAARSYPKAEETSGWRDIWRSKDRGDQA